jgi:hypothetical protein
VSLKTYDSNKVNISFAGRTIDKGRADGEFVSTEYATETFTTKVGADGEVTRSKSNDNSATIKIKVMQTSAGHALLTQLHALARASVNGSDVGAFELRDLNGNMLERADECYIEKAPPSAFGKEAVEREWTLRAANLIREVGV